MDPKHTRAWPTLPAETDVSRLSTDPLVPLLPQVPPPFHVVCYRPARSSSVLQCSAARLLLPHCCHCCSSPGSCCEQPAAHASCIACTAACWCLLQPGSSSGPAAASQAVVGQAALHAACNQVHILLASGGDAAATLGAWEQRTDTAGMNTRQIRQSDRGAMRFRTPHCHRRARQPAAQTPTSTVPLVWPGHQPPPHARTPPVGCWLSGPHPKNSACCTAVRLFLVLPAPLPRGTAACYAAAAAVKPPAIPPPPLARHSSNPCAHPVLLTSVLLNKAH